MRFRLGTGKECKERRAEGRCKEFGGCEPFDKRAGGCNLANLSAGAPYHRHMPHLQFRTALDGANNVLPTNLPRGRRPLKF